MDVNDTPLDTGLVIVESLHATDRPVGSEMSLP